MGQIIIRLIANLFLVIVILIAMWLVVAGIVVCLDCSISKDISQVNLINSTLMFPVLCIFFLCLVLNLKDTESSINEQINELQIYKYREFRHNVVLAKLRREIEEL